MEPEGAGVSSAGAGAGVIAGVIPEAGGIRLSIDTDSG
jgi:hypothetical protein